jgi:hypothetical protein
MKKKINIDSTTFWFLYRKYQQFLLPAGVIGVSLLVFIFIIFPQFSTLLDNQRQAKLESAKLAVLKGNLNLLTTLNETETDSQLQTVSRAFPSEKAFGGILTAISAAANKTGVSLGDFQFQVGNITNPTIVGTAIPNLEIVLTVNGDITSVLKFVNELYKSVPLSEVTSIKIHNPTTEVTADFYYRPFPSLIVNEATPIQPVSPDGLTIINNISSWGYAQDTVPLYQTPSSASPSASTTGTNP